MEDATTLRSQCTRTEYWPEREAMFPTSSQPKPSAGIRNRQGVGQGTLSMEMYSLNNTIVMSDKLSSQTKSLFLFLFKFLYSMQFCSNRRIFFLACRQLLHHHGEDNEASVEKNCIESRVFFPGCTFVTLPLCARRPDSMDRISSFQTLRAKWQRM